MAVTPNKGYTNQVTGTNSGTWGVVLNSNFSIIDDNLGGTLSLSVAGSANVNLTTSQAQNLIYNFTGALTGNINVIFPAQGGLYFINNETTGAFTLTIQSGASTSGFLVPQGNQAAIYVDNSTIPPTIGGAAGTQYVFTGGTVGGTANALTTSTTFPTNFTLSNGTFITLTPTADNTGPATLNVNGTGNIAINKLGATGLTALQNGDIFAGIPNILQYNGSVWIALNIVYYGTPTQVSGNFGLTFANWLEPIIATTAITITVPQVSVDFTYYFSLPVTAGGGNITWTPFSTDVIWVNGVALAAGVSYVQPQGSTVKFNTDANGNIYLAVANGSVGVTNGSNAPAGSVGEFISSSVALGSALGLTSGIPTDVTHINLTAGDWDVWGNICYSQSGNAVVRYTSWISSVSGTDPGSPNNGARFDMFVSAGDAEPSSLPIGMIRASLSTTSSYYLSTTCAFASGSISAYGFIGARRVR